MINVLINAYAVSPIWGSEQGMGWNWAISIAEHCNVFVITEGEWKEEIENAVSSLPQKDNIHFYYLPVSRRVRNMCWNQGDWRFYFHYYLWQKRALKLAKTICSENKIDIIHQLNMVGFREPGLLWKIKDIPFVIGPVAGRTSLNLNYISECPITVKAKYALKNVINKIQFNFSPRVVSAFKRASAIITPMKDMADSLSSRYASDVYIIPETGLDNVNMIADRIHDKYLDLLWVGRFMETKQLPLALRTLSMLNNKEMVRLTIVGYGLNDEEKRYMRMADELGVAGNCIWKGKLDNGQVKKIMKEMDALFFTSIYEVTSTVVPEAIQAGLPIICHNICGFGPLIDEKIGWTIPMISKEKSAEGFARIIDGLCNNPTQLEKDGRDFNMAAEKLTYKSKAIRMLEIYNSILPEV